MVVKFKIDDRIVEAEQTATILDAAQTVGIKIPTLCSQVTFAPRGLPVLFIQKLRVGRNLQLPAHRVEEGIEVKTSSPRVIKSRRMTMSFLLLRCPDVPKIKELADEIGINEAIIRRLNQDHEDCVLCGLNRVCRERMGVGAIDFV